MNKQNWWKWASFFLILFAVIVGLGAPLAPGIESVAPLEARAGDTVQLRIQTVNSHFNSHPQFLQAGLLGTNRALKPLSLKLAGQGVIEASFLLPENLVTKKDAVNMLDLEVSSAFDGLLVLKQALTVRPDSNFLNSGKVIAPVADEKLKIHNLTPQYFNLPYREILYESIRNLFFHVCMWFAMLTVFGISVVYSIRYLKTGRQEYDWIACEGINVGVIFGILGLLTGTLWAKFTWGDWWPNDAKLNGTLISMLLYFAYIILRNSIEEEQKRAKISAVYNIFAFPMMLVLIVVIPGLSDSLHPGNGGNPGFATYDLDNHMRVAFYPASAGWILMSIWLLNIRFRMRKLEYDL